MKTKEKNSKIRTGQMERRTFTAPVEIRAKEEGEGRTVEGYAAVFNEETDMLWWREQIAPGAFSEVLKDDVRALFNHDPNLILARSSNTLELWEDEKGLGYRFEAPDTTAGNDLLKNIRNGNVTQSSFGFTIGAYKWEDREDDEVITITKVERLFDISPVTFPAYETTEVTARSMAEYRNADEGETEAPEQSEQPNRVIAAISGKELSKRIGDAIREATGGKQLVMFDAQARRQEEPPAVEQEQRDEPETGGEEPTPQTVHDDLEYYRLRLAELEE